MIAPGNTSPPEFFLVVQRRLAPCHDGLDIGVGLTSFEMIEAPEPSATALGLVSIAGLAVVAWRRRRASGGQRGAR